MDPKHNLEPINVPAIAASLGPYQPKHIQTYNQESVRVACCHGRFIWHAHPETDELFYVVSGGPLLLEVANAETNNEADGYGVVTMNPGDLFNIPRHRRHRPHADVEVQVLVFDRTGTVNTGDAADSEEGKLRTVVVHDGGEQK